MTIGDVAIRMLNGAAAIQGLPQEMLKKFLQQLENMESLVGVIPMFQTNRAQSGEFFYIQALYVGDWHISNRRKEMHGATQHDVEVGARLVFEQIQKETEIPIDTPCIYERYAEATAKFPPEYAELRIKLEQ